VRDAARHTPRACVSAALSTAQPGKALQSAGNLTLDLALPDICTSGSKSEVARCPTGVAARDGVAYGRPLPRHGQLPGRGLSSAIGSLHWGGASPYSSRFMLRMIETVAELARGDGAGA